MDQKSGKPSQKRRAILQGTLAAPVVLTVSSPTAAQVSSHMRCLANIGNDQPGLFFASSETADRWLRYPIEVVQFTKGTASGWFYNDPSFNGYVNIADITKLADLQGWNTNHPATSTRWALVWVEAQSGTPWRTVQIQKPMSGYQFTTLSCNASVNPTAQ